MALTLFTNPVYNFFWRIKSEYDPFTLFPGSGSYNENGTASSAGKVVFAGGRSASRLHFRDRRAALGGLCSPGAFDSSGIHRIYFRLGSGDWFVEGVYD
jgi:hypothetical protein